MKNRSSFWLLLFTCVFLSCLIGFYIGRNTGRTHVDISTLKPSTSQSATSGSATEITNDPTIININTADSKELQTLPGIGPVLAQRIIDYRTEFGPFDSVYDLTLVNGIGLNTLEKLLDLITVGGES